MISFFLRSALRSSPSNSSHCYRVDSIFLKRFRNLLCEHSGHHHCENLCSLLVRVPALIPSGDVMNCCFFPIFSATEVTYISPAVHQHDTRTLRSQILDVIYDRRIDTINYTPPDLADYRQLSYWVESWEQQSRTFFKSAHQVHALHSVTSRAFHQVVSRRQQQQPVQSLVNLESYVAEIRTRKYLWVCNLASPFLSFTNRTNLAF